MAKQPKKMTKEAKSQAIIKSNKENPRKQTFNIVRSDNNEKTTERIAFGRSDKSDPKKESD